MLGFEVFGAASIVINNHWQSGRIPAPAPRVSPGAACMLIASVQICVGSWQLSRSSLKFALGAGLSQASDWDPGRPGAHWPRLRCRLCVTEPVTMGL
jgi:hypothetical protein